MTLRPLVSGTLAESARVVARAGGAGRIALVDGSTRWTWADLDDRADAVARGLLTAGVGAGARVAVVALPSAATLATLHGIARVGAVAAPVGTGLTRYELAAAAEVITARAVVVGPGFEDEGAMLSGRVLRLDRLGDGGRGQPQPPDAPGDPADPGDPSVIILTSGTTGRPKAVALTATALTASAQSWLAALPPASTWLLAVGLAHVAGIGVVWRAALSGVPVVVLERADPASIVAALGRRPAPSHVSLVPTTLARILDATGDARPPATLIAVPLGGGPIPEALVRRALAAGWPIITTYGLTEAGSGVTALPTGDAAAHPDSAGPALPGVRIRIAGADATGIGEIEVDTAARFSGYLDEPEATAAAFTNDGWLRTGDLGSLDADGRLMVADRRTDRIVRGGENIAPSEVEAVLRDHPAIADAGVVARRDATFGQVPVAAIVLRPRAADPGDEELTAFCLERLGRFKVPAAYTRLDALPRTTGGKLQRAVLRARLDPGPPRERRIDRPDGASIAYRTFGDGPRHVLLLHGTLSTGAQLTGLARLLAVTGDMTVHAVDRRGSGASRLAEPAPIDVAVHVDDLAAILDAERAADAILVGISYGACLALEFAARRPARTTAVIAYEPPYGPAADARTRAEFAAVASATELAYRTAGAAGAAEAFLTGVAGPDAWTTLPDRARAFLADEGGGAYADAALLGFDIDGLAGIAAPVTIATGDASQPFYRPIADSLATRIRGSRRMHLPGMAHASPITDPGPIADVVRAALEGPPA
jgi:O-succinylbenzoic acid--CoA ligase